MTMGLPMAVLTAIRPAPLAIMAGAAVAGGNPAAAATTRVSGFRIRWLRRTMRQRTPAPA